MSTLHRRMRSITRSLLATAVLAVGAAAPAQAAELVPVDTFAEPIFVTAPPDDDQRLFVVERGGKIRIVKDGERVGGRFLEVPGGVSTDGERGLLSMAFHPNYAKNRLFYVFYTEPSGRRPPDRRVQAPGGRRGRGEGKQPAKGPRDRALRVREPQRRPAPVRPRRAALHRDRRRRRWRRHARQRAGQGQPARQAPADRPEGGRRRPLLRPGRQPVRGRATVRTRSTRTACATRSASRSIARTAT